MNNQIANKEIEQEHTKVIYVKRKEYYGNIGFYPRCDFSRELLRMISFKRKCFTEFEILKLSENPLNFYIEFVDNTFSAKEKERNRITN